MRYFIDAEYDFNDDECRIVPISIGVVAEDGREYYAVTDFFENFRWPDGLSMYVEEHVIPALGTTERKDRDVIASDLVRFMPDVHQFWGDYADFDYVVMSILMGGFHDWPKHWPMFCHDLQQTPEGWAASERYQSLTPHNALADARAVYAACLAVEGRVSE